MIHIRIQQRNGRKTLTSVQGLSEQYDLKYVLLSYYRACKAISFFFRKIIKVCKRHFACNGTVVEHPEYGEVIQFQGFLHFLKLILKTFLR